MSDLQILIDIREEWQAGIHDSGTDVSYIIANNSTL